MTRHRPKQQKTQNDSSSLKSIDDIAKKFTRKIDLQKKILELSKILEAQDETIDVLTAELTKLKLAEASGEIQVFDKMPESEKLIADVQLKRLKEAALGRDLTLEETRKFEIFSKIKNMDSNKDKEKPPVLPRDVTPRTLMAIAAGDPVKKSDE